MKPACISVLVVSVSAIFQFVCAQQGDYSMGARNTAMGGTGVALADPFSSFSNQAGVARLERSSLLFSVRNLYSLDGLLALGAAYYHKYRQGAFLLNLYRFGDHLFSEHKIGIGYSHQIRFVSLGMQANYLQQRVESSGTAGALLIELGGMAELIPGLIVGAYLSNPARTTIGQEVREPLPVVMKAGLTYLPDEHTTLCLDIQHIAGIQRGPGTSTRLKLGLEYILRNLFPLRAGVIFNPAKMSFGFGVYLKKLKVDYGILLDARLGMTHEFSILYQFSGR